MADLSKALLTQQGRPVTLAPCTVTSTSPLLITVFGQPNVPAVRIANTTVSLGAANALLAPGTSPIVLPIG